MMTDANDPPKPELKPTCSVDRRGDSITCFVCGVTSRNPHDVYHRYCGNCHQFHPIRPEEAKP